MKNQTLELFQYANTSLFAVSTYNPWLVVLSISIAILASFMGFQVASQAAKSSSLRKHFSLFIGSLALGGGVWSMHFIGMLALELCTPVSYQFDLTVLSVLPAVSASWIALNLITRKNLRFYQLIIGGVLVGAGIGTMHYLGMAAMDMAPLLRYDLFMFSVSIFVAIVLAILSLWVRFGLDDIGKIHLSSKLKMTISSCVMGMAISGMHYTGMAAARFVLPPGFEISKQSNDVSLYLALGITTITVFIICLVLAANLVFRYKDISAKALQSERRLSATMDTAVDGIITINEKGIIVSINKAVTKLLDWESEELLGKNVKMIVPEPFQHDHDLYIENFLQTGDAKVIGTGREVEALTKGGSTIPIRLGIGHVKLNNQHMFVAFISDLRERLTMEFALREKELRISALLTNIPGIAYRCLDVPGWPNLFINDEVEKVTGFPAEDFLLPEPKRSLADFIHPDDLDTIESTDLRHPDGYQLEFRFIDRYKTVKWMLGYGRATKIEGTEDYHLDGFIMDISERKQMEVQMWAAKEKAEKAAETRTAFLANMSHEIRTPMNAVIGFSDILLDEDLKTNQRKYLNTINQSAKSLLHILNDILDSAKLDKGKFQLEYRDFSLVEEVDAVVSTLWIEAHNKGLTLNLYIEKEVQGYYNGAPDRLRQVLTNLLGNAIKFTTQGSIDIKVVQIDDKHVQFVIKDTGIGMTAAQLDIIFDAFAQADESMSRRFGGTGLGTTISKQLVELMGGKISATSINGEGSEFSFCLPMQPVKFIEESKQQNQQPIPSLHVLVVDDIDQNIDLLTLILKRQGHSVSEARDGEQALVQMENNIIDLVLMDIQMPVMDGLTAVKHRRQYEEKNGLTRIPIIALTASVLPQDRLSAEQAGMDGFSNKPINIPQLLTEISRVIGQGFLKTIAKPVDKTELKIDVKAGTELWGSKATFYTEICRFIKASETEVFTINQLLKKEKWQELEQLAHKYKGSAGNLSLNRLTKIFDELERSIKIQAVTLTKKHIANIEIEFNAIKHCVHHMTDLYQDDKVMNTANTSELINFLKRLKQSVNNNEYDEALLDELQSIGSIKPLEIKAIISAYNDFEFVYTGELIELLINKLQSINNLD